MAVERVVEDTADIVDRSGKDHRYHSQDQCLRDLTEGLDVFRGVFRSPGLDLLPLHEKEDDKDQQSGEGAAPGADGASHGAPGPGDPVCVLFLRGEADQHPRCADTDDGVDDLLYHLGQSCGDHGRMALPVSPAHT